MWQGGYYNEPRKGTKSELDWEGRQQRKGCIWETQWVGDGPADQTDLEESQQQVSVSSWVQQWCHWHTD